MDLQLARIKHEESIGLSDSVDDIAFAAPHYWVEMICSFVYFCLVGIEVCISTYLETYAIDIGVISKSECEYLLVAFFMASAVGSLAIAYDTIGTTLSRLMWQYALAGIICCIMLVVIILLPLNSTALWVGLIIFGFFVAPMGALNGNLSHHLTAISDVGTALMLVGVNLGELVFVLSLCHQNRI